jgi:hypothetical protein
MKYFSIPAKSLPAKMLGIDCGPEAEMESIDVIRFMKAHPGEVCCRFLKIAIPEGLCNRSLDSYMFQLKLLLPIKQDSPLSRNPAPP